jgi:hypothetical protein
VRSWVVSSCALATLASAVTPVAAQSPQALALSRGDSAEILRSAFRFATQGHNSRRRVLWFWTPSRPDSGALSFSPDVRAILLASGLTASENRPVGDDTVVFRVVSWQPIPAGAKLTLQSQWTEVRQARAPCRAGSANHAVVRVQRQNGDWVAAFDEPVVHGDEVCRPVRPEAGSASRPGSVRPST